MNSGFTYINETGGGISIAVPSERVWWKPWTWLRGPYSLHVPDGGSIVRRNGRWTLSP